MGNNEILRRIVISVAPHPSGYQLIERSLSDTFPNTLFQIAYLKVNPKLPLLILKLFQDIALENEDYFKKCG